MAQIPVLSGIYTDNGPDFRRSYPVNLVPVALPNGISNGYVRPADGARAVGTGPGIDRGGIEVNGFHYRVMGTKFVQVLADNSVITIGDVGGSGPVTLDYSFTLMAIASSGMLWYYDLAANTLTQVTDPDLGTVLDVAWVDGYFMTTDGQYLVVTELSDPYAVNPLKYGSSEADPDPVVAIIKLRNEIYALNRHTIEVFDNVGGELFPFERIEGAQIQKGCVGTHACCQFADAIAFLGNGRNEAPSVYLGANGNAQKIATREIDTILAGYTETQLAAVEMESRIGNGQQQLFIHLPDRTLGYDIVASQAVGEPVWFVLTGALFGFSAYRPRHLTYVNDNWYCGDTASSSVAILDPDIGTQFGNEVRWEFGTTIIYNESRGAIVNEMELVALTGRVAVGTNPTISTAYSLDGQTWSMERYIAAGGAGDRTKRLCWFRCGILRNWRIQRFSGTSNARLSFARLEAQLEPLAY